MSQSSTSHIVKLTPPGTVQDVYIRSWQLAFVQDCDMRCAYCVTGYGRLGKTAGTMSREVQAELLSLIFRGAFRGHEIELDFGNGETLLYFDEFLQFIEAAERMALDKAMPLSIHVATNGISLDEEKMQTLADHQVALTFSIDGPDSVHDRYRIDADGRPTHARAMNNWRRYREIISARPEKIACNISSVIGDDESLLDINDFWLSQGLETYNCTIAQPSDFLGEWDYQKWQERRASYLQDLEGLAMEQARKLKIPDFLSEFRGPDVIRSAWVNLLVDRDAGACGVAESMVGVDMHGNIYPCDSFTGQTHWRIGSVHSGFDRKVLDKLRGQIGQLRSVCGACEEQQLCEGGCVATRIDTTLKLNLRGACAFNKQVAKIGRYSYQVLLENS
jgi:uncharacterized protein